MLSIFISKNYSVIAIENHVETCDRTGIYPVYYVPFNGPLLSKRARLHTIFYHYSLNIPHTLNYKDCLKC